MKIVVLIFFFLFSGLIQVQSKLYEIGEEGSGEEDILEEDLEPKVALNDIMAVIKAAYDENFIKESMC
jgi:hypothetical protein